MNLHWGTTRWTSEKVLEKHWRVASRFIIRCTHLIQSDNRNYYMDNSATADGVAQHRETTLDSLLVPGCSHGQQFFTAILSSIIASLSHRRCFHNLPWWLYPCQTPHTYWVGISWYGHWDNIRSPTHLVATQSILFSWGVSFFNQIVLSNLRSTCSFLSAKVEEHWSSTTTWAMLHMLCWSCFHPSHPVTQLQKVLEHPSLLAGGQILKMHDWELSLSNPSFLWHDQ